MNLLAAAIIFTCQGISFFHAGEEFLRSKPINEEKTLFEGNSYRSPDSVNSLKWNQRTTYHEVVDYYKGLIALRKSSKALRMIRAEDIRAYLRFVEWQEPNIVAFTIEYPEDNRICVIYNSNREYKTIHIPEGAWKVYVKGIRSGTEILDTVEGSMVSVEPISALIMQSSY